MQITTFEQARTILFDVMAQLEEIPDDLWPAADEHIERAYRELDDAYAAFDTAIEIRESYKEVT